MLIIESVESARCVEEGVLIQTADANIGSIMGIGFPPWTGGVLQYINGFPGGVAAFVARADEFADKHGERFAPNPLLRTKAENSEKFRSLFRWRVGWSAVATTRPSFVGPGASPIHAPCRPADPSSLITSLA